MFDILIYLFESYFDVGSYPELEKLSLKLSAAGFENDEINDAITWLSALQSPVHAGYRDDFSHSGLRHFADLETRLISDEARRFLYFSEQQGMISPLEREMIIDRAFALQFDHLGLDQLKLIMLMVLWNRRSDLDPLLAEELLSPINSAQLH